MWTSVTNAEQQSSPVGNRDAEAENVADVGEGGLASGSSLAGGDGLDGAADEADDLAATRTGRLSYLSCPRSNQIIKQKRSK